MGLCFRHARTVLAGGLLLISMWTPAPAQLPPDGSKAHSGLKECSHSTPLPKDTAITPPKADVSAEFAIFSGVWGGRWGRTSSGTCTTLVVEEVLANGLARVIYSIGAFDPHVRVPRYYRTSGRIRNGVLSFGLPAPSRAEYAFRPVGSNLVGTYKEGTAESRITVAPIDNVRQIGCPTIPPVTPPLASTRNAILASELLGTWTDAGPVHNDYFVPMGRPTPARHSLRGSLTIPALQTSSAHRGCAGLLSPSPAFTVEFLTHADQLVPVQRTIIWSTDRRFGIILSPGRVWSEPEDQGLSRASFPFALVNPIDNGTLNGLATFVFDDTRVSNLRVQITQQTMAWSRPDYFG